MDIRFNNSLSEFLRVAIDAGVTVDDQTVVLRDGVGRLLLARKDVGDPSVFEADIRAVLGGYAAPVVLVTGGAATRLLGDPSLMSVTTDLGGVEYRYKYADRRVVGADWLETPAAHSAKPRIVFGSLKGGVGRSTALTVFAADLARKGKRVLAIDLDLEAPGIGYMLLPSTDATGMDLRPRYGVLDYLIENSLGEVDDADLVDFVGISPFLEGSIDVMPAVGRDTDDHPQTMIAKLSRALVEDESNGEFISFSAKVRKMVERFEGRADYDVVLIDARAGLAEISAGPLTNLGAEVLLFGTDQPQTFQGYSYLLAHLSNVTKDSSWAEHVVFVHGKSPSAASKRQPFRDRVYELCANFLYEEESLSLDGQVLEADFAPGPNEKGPGVPHDVLHVGFHPDYDAFDPVGDISQLDPEVYSGPFGSFLNRVWELSGLNLGETT